MGFCLSQSLWRLVLPKVSNFRSHFSFYLLMISLRKPLTRSVYFSSLLLVKALPTSIPDTSVASELSQISAWTCTNLVCNNPSRLFFLFASLEYLPYSSRLIFNSNSIHSTESFQPVTLSVSSPLCWSLLPMVLRIKLAFESVSDASFIHSKLESVRHLNTSLVSTGALSTPLLPDRVQRKAVWLIYDPSLISNL